MERADRNRNAGIALGILLTCCRCAFALDPSLDINQYAHNAWTIRDGFFKGAINSIAQTPDGYLWLGTEFGLVRFDGVRSVPWQPSAGEHLPSSYIRKLLVARDGRLWIGTNEGLASWKDGKLTHYGELAGLGVFALVEDRGGTVWAGTSATPVGRLCAVQNGRAQCYGEDGSFSRGVLSLYEDRGGNLWVGAETGLWRWKPGPPKLYPTTGPAVEIRDLIAGDNGLILMSMAGGIRQLVDGKADAFPLPRGRGQYNPNKLLRDRDGGLWVGTNERGIFHIHQGRTDVFRRFDGLSGDFIGPLFEDREGNIWVATVGGLDRFRDLAVPTISNEHGLSNAYVWSVLAARDGMVWLSTRDGLNRWNDGRITIYRKYGSGLPDNVESLYEDDHGRIWASTAGGLAYFENGQFVPEHAVPAGHVHSMAGDRTGNLWVNQDQTLIHLVEGTVVERVPWTRLGRRENPWALQPDPVRGGLWLGFGDGLVYFKDGELRASYGTAEGSDLSPVTGLQLDRDGTLWAATAGGLSRVKDGHVATLTSKNGLPCDTVHWAIEDDDHSFWLYTACGLVRIARTDLDAWVTDSKWKIQATIFDSLDGVRIHSGPYSSYSPRVAKAADGKLWFVTGDGVSVIDPRHIPLNKLPPPVHVEEVKVDGNPWDASQGWRLPARTRDLEIHYTALSLVAPEKNRFKYKLEGRDSDWKDAGNERKASYTDLPPRSYRFRVMASNNSGVWNEAGDLLDFSIAPAYYQTRWFQASCVAAILALVWALYRYRLHQVAREFNVRLEERVGERVRIARELHDTLLQTVQGLMLRLQVVDEMLPPGKVKEELEQTLEVGDQAIIEGRNTVHDLRSQLTTELPPAVRGLGDELASGSSATFRLVVEGPVVDLNPIVRDELYRIAREALRNAFAHAKAKRIEAEITYDHWLFRLRIRDDGEGIPAEILDEGRSGHFGLAGMRERAKQNGWKLTIWSGAGAGTEIDVSVAGSVAYAKPSAGSRFWRLHKRFWGSPKKGG